MAIMQLNLEKEGEQKPVFKMNLAKEEKFQIELFWDSEHDLDGHGILGINTGNGAKISDMSQILSTYNNTLPLADGSASSRKVGDKRPFMTPCGSLHHSGDAKSGIGVAIDEIITVNGAKIPAGVNEIPIFVTIHPSKSAKFSEVKMAGIRIKDDSGTTLAEYQLSDQFGEFDAVQLGSFVLNDGAWEYAAVGVGFNGDFNAIVKFFC